MWATSSLFTATIGTPHRVKTVVTVTPPGKTATTLRLTAGSWSFTSGQTIRRTASLTLDGDLTTYRLLATPGAIIRISHGFQWSGGVSELIPVLTGELSSAAKTWGDGSVTVTVADFGQRLARANYITPYSPATSLSRMTAITTALTEAVPAATVTNLTTGTSTVGVTNTWSSRASLVSDLATDAGAEAYFLPDGNFRIRPLPQVTDQPVYLVKRGIGGTLRGFSRTRPLDKLYNTVIVLPASVDGTQPWTRQVAQISDTSNPRHPNYIGVSPFEWTAPTILTATEAASIAGTLLTQVQGSTETLALDLFANPALDAGDVIRITDMDTGGIVNHLIDSGSGDLIAGTMNLATRAAFEVSA